MNSEHYQKVQSVSKQCEDMLKQEIERTKARGTGRPAINLSAACKAAAQLWVKEFPEEQGFGGRVHLDLQGADLAYACFFGVDQRFNGANFFQADLKESKWIECYAEGIDLTDANLEHANMLLTRCSGWVFRGANLSRSRFEMVMLESDTPADFTNANLTDAQITFMGPAPLILNGAKMSNCRVSFKASPVLASDRAQAQRAREKFLASLSKEQRGAVILSDGRPSRCFIATAACGSEHEEDVVVLRDFRDRFLMEASVGRDFIRGYKYISPSIARFISRWGYLRWAVRTLVVRPAAFAARLGLLSSD